MSEWDAVDWWLSPALCYAKGLHDGAQLERDRIAAEDDALHRAAVKSAIAHIDRVDRRRAYDRGEPPP